MTGDIDDVKAYIDDKITEQMQQNAWVSEQHGQPFPEDLNSQLTLLREIRKELEWIEVDGYTPKNPEAGDRDA